MSTSEEIARKIHKLYEEGRVKEAQELELSVVEQTEKPNTDGGEAPDASANS